MTDLQIRPFKSGDLTHVRDIFIDWNRSIAPEGQEAVFEAYIERSLAEEIERIPDYYAPDGWGFWVAEADGEVAAMYGLEGLPDDPGAVEIRRMYVAAGYRRRGIGRTLMAHAEDMARDMGYERIVLSTSALQPQAKALYEATGYDLVREEIAEAPSNRTVGGGLRRYYFEKSVA